MKTEDQLVEALEAEVKAIAKSRSKASGRTREQEYVAVLRERPELADLLLPTLGERRARRRALAKALHDEPSRAEAQAKLETLVRDLRLQRPGLTHEAGVVEALRLEPGLYPKL